MRKSPNVADMLRHQSTEDILRWRAEEIARVQTGNGIDPAELFALTAELDRRSTEV